MRGGSGGHERGVAGRSEAVDLLDARRGGDHVVHPVEQRHRGAHVADLAVDVHAGVGVALHAPRHEVLGLVLEAHPQLDRRAWR